MKQTLHSLLFLLFYFSIAATGNKHPSGSIHNKHLNTSDTLTGSIYPFVKDLFYKLPLEKSRQDLREIILHDQRFVSTDSIFNHLEPSAFFKGMTSNKGIITSNPDSIQVVLFPGHTSLSTEKDGEADFKDIVLLNFKYFYSGKDPVETEMKRILDMLHPLFKDSISENSETPYTKGIVRGQMTVNSEIFQHFHPYYRVGISSITMVPSDPSKSVFILDIVFSKEDKN